MPDKNPQPQTRSRTFAIGIGVTEAFLLLGFISLAAGIFLLLGTAWALIVTGALLYFTALYNDYMRSKKGK